MSTSMKQDYGSNNSQFQLLKVLFLQFWVLNYHLKFQTSLVLCFSLRHLLRLEMTRVTCEHLVLGKYDAQECVLKRFGSSG